MQNTMGVARVKDVLTDDPGESIGEIIQPPRSVQNDLNELRHCFRLVVMSLLPAFVSMKRA